MEDLPPTARDSEQAPAGGSPVSHRAGHGVRGFAGTPRWARVCAAIAILLVVLVIVMLVLGHGPGRHLRGEAAAGPALSAEAAAVARLLPP
jgi:hypothetical protein